MASRSATASPDPSRRSCWKCGTKTCDRQRINWRPCRTRKESEGAGALKSSRVKTICAAEDEIFCKVTSKCCAILKIYTLALASPGAALRDLRADSCRLIPRQASEAFFH